MSKQENLQAVILISEDNLFVTHCINLLHSIYENAFYERSYGKEDFAVLMNELQKEGFNAAWIIIDDKTKGNEIIELFKIIREFESKMTLDIKVGVEGYFNIEKI
jgi:hypothetical protein